MKLKKCIYYVIPNVIKVEYLSYKASKMGYHIPVYAGDDMKEQMNKYIPLFKESDTSLRNIKLCELEKDMCKAWYRYKISPHEYLMYGFFGKSKRERSLYVSDVYKDYMLDTYDGHSNYEFLSDKYAFYQKASKYFNREVMTLTSNTAMEDFVNFAVRNRNLFIKMNGGSYGHGTTVADLFTEEEARNFFYANLMGGVIS